MNKQTVPIFKSCICVFAADFNAKYAAYCQCPVPCEYNIYEPAISYAAISKHAISKLATSSERLSLKSKLMHGSETTERMDNVKREELKVLVQTFDNRFTDLMHLYDRVSYHLSNQLSAIVLLRNETNSVFSEIDRLYRFQKYIVERNFLRPREAMEERTLRNVALGFVEFEMINVKRINQLANVSFKDSSVREMYYNLIIDSVTVRQKITGLARENITELVNAFETGTKIFDYQFEDIDKTHTPFIVPKKLLNDSLHNNWYVIEFTKRLLSSFDLIYNSLELLKEEATKVYLNQSVNTTTLNDAFGEYSKACREFMYSKSVFYSHGLDRIVPVIEERKEAIGKLWDEFDERSLEIQYHTIALNANLETMMIENIPTLDTLVRDLVLYVNSTDKSLMKVALQSASTDTERAKRSIADLYHTINLTGQNINDSWSVMLETLESLWSNILMDEDMKEYHEFTNNKKFLQNLTDVLESYKCRCAHVGEDFAVKHARHNEERDFLAVFEDIEDYLASFKESIKIDSTFLRYICLQ